MRKLLALLALVSLATVLVSQDTVVVVRHKVAPVSGGVFKGESHANPAGGGATVVTGALNVATNDLIVVFAGNGSDTIVGVVCSNGDTLTRAKDNNSFSPFYDTSVFYKLGATAGASTTCTITFTSTSVLFPAYVAANWSGVSPTATVLSSCNSATCDAIAAGATARTAQNVTPAAGTVLLIGGGLDWDGNSTHANNVNGFTSVVAVAADGTTGFLAYKNVAANGSTAYPSGSFTTGASQQYFSMFLSFQW
jgi:hypothetical protein